MFEGVNMMEVYLDNSATTRCLPEVAALMTRIMCEEYGNPSSMHKKGVESEKYVRYAKEVIAKCMKVQEKEILFTSGGTESDNIALIGGAYANCRAGRHIITTRIEHPAVLQTCAYLEEQGFAVTYLPVDAKGVISLVNLERAMTKNTILVSIMHTNNEVGAVQPIEQAGELIKRMNPNTLFHVDAVQGFGKCRIYPKRMHIDLLSVSAHKIHGPKGVGFLYIDERAKVRPIIFGGGQQKGMRSGTENVPGIAGMARAIEEIFSDLDEKIEYLYSIKERFVEGVRALDGIRLNGPVGRDGAPHVVSVSIQGVRSEVMLHALEDKGIYVSAGSACSSNKPSTSATLKAIGVEKQYLDTTLRFSFSLYTTEADIDYTVNCLSELLPMLRKYTRK
jgi:Cysteine sulfinate desulfinase/cysteine desulfurase and related enzymes